jgi:hypothetical protein
MSALQRFVALVVAVAALSAGLASPAQADLPPPEIGTVCRPHPDSPVTPSELTVDFWLQNRTNWTFGIVRSHLNQGAWDTSPPVWIAPWEWVCWRSVSRGFVTGAPTGTQGWVTYEAKDSGGAVRLTLVWTKLFARANSFECRPPVNHECPGRPGSGGGNHPTPIFQLASRV